MKITEFKNNIPTLSGVYKFMNISTGKMYIGSSYNLRKRFYNHLKLLRKGTHHSIKFQNAYNKYGEDDFIYEILEIIEDVNLLLKKEQYFLDNLLFADEFINKQNLKFYELSYNINPKANSRLGTTQSSESIFKSKINNPNRKDILQFDFNGNLIKE